METEKKCIGCPRETSVSRLKWGLNWGQQPLKPLNTMYHHSAAMVSEGFQGSPPQLGCSHSSVRGMIVVVFCFSCKCDDQRGLRGDRCSFSRLGDLPVCHTHPVTFYRFCVADGKPTSIDWRPSALGAHARVTRKLLGFIIALYRTLRGILLN